MYIYIHIIHINPSLKKVFEHIEVTLEKFNESI